MVKKVLRYKIDLIPVAIVIAVVSIQLSAVVWHWPWYSIPLILLLIRHVSLTEHNHAHLGIFASNTLNEVFGWLCFLSNGIPLEFYRVHHVKNHHRYNQLFNDLEKDWSSTFGFRGCHFPDQPVSKAYYVLTFPVITTASCLIHLLRSPGSKSLKRFTASLAVIVFISIGLCLVNWTGFIMFLFVPWTVVIFAHGFNNYNQHIGCSLDDPYNSANESLSVFGKAIWLNIGYHIEHHMKPSLHWSKLPNLHRQIRPLIPSERLYKKIRNRRERHPVKEMAERINQQEC